MASIEPCGEEDVFDISVPAIENFVANDIFVHKSTYARCGIIVNVTPFEPEWEGYVTLEFSNTTPLPAKIYANEGVAQVIFFESDEVCETSYKDRGREVPGQQGVTLPEILMFLAGCRSTLNEPARLCGYSTKRNPAIRP